MDEEAAIRRIALAALRDHPTVSLREIYAQLTDGAVEANAAHHLRRQRIVQVLKRSLSLTPVYFDRKSQESLIWARSDAILSPPRVRLEEVMTTVAHQPASGQASLDMRYRHLQMGVLLLSPADAHNLELSSGPQPYRRAVFLRIEDGDAARQYLVWYDAAQQLLYDLAYFYRQEGVKISSCLHLNLLEQPATYRVRYAKREPDAAYAADLEIMQAARRGYDFTPANAPADQVIGLRRAIELQVDDLEQRLSNLQRLVAQLWSDEARR